MNVVLDTHLPGIPKRQGKVRDVYDFGEKLLIVATDRISAYDWVMPNGIPDKGRILTQLSLFWFDFLGDRNHLLSTDPTTLPLPAGTDLSPLEGRSMVVRKTEVIPVECVVRGYLTGSGWSDYQRTGRVSGILLPPGLLEASELADPIFTPSTKAESGHDMPISIEEVSAQCGQDLTTTIHDRSLSIYRRAAEYARTRGLILADTKFEFGRYRPDPGSPEEIILIDEVLTPDSSRFWPAAQYAPGRPQPSFDKQYVRDWLSQSGWDKNSPPPELPEEIVANTRAKYLEAYELLTGLPFP
ncbi:MAG: phosphoribosylaminoimidazolesuccinocarboxamide synthase [Planctomycetaceae bacterium]|nr:phosphoribosylaminoimidazolesuccinocarboxamide synthase [Planctomycetaceae bacterium]